MLTYVYKEQTDMLIVLPLPRPLLEDIQNLTTKLEFHLYSNNILL